GIRYIGKTTRFPALESRLSDLSVPLGIAALVASPSSDISVEARNQAPRQTPAAGCQCCDSHRTRGESRASNSLCRPGRPDVGNLTTVCCANGQPREQATGKRRIAP